MGVDERKGFLKVTGYFKDKTAKKVAKAIDKMDGEFLWMEKSMTFIPFRKVWYIWYK